MLRSLLSCCFSAATLKTEDLFWMGLLPWAQEVPSSNLVAPTKTHLSKIFFWIGLVIFLRLAAVGTWRSFWRTCHTKCVELRGGNCEFRFRGMICMRKQLSVQSERAYRWRVLITGAIRHKRF